MSTLVLAITLTVSPLGGQFGSRPHAVTAFQQTNSGEPSRSATHIRSLNQFVTEALHEGLAKSPALRALVAELEASNVILYLEEGHCPKSAACTMIATTPDRRVRLLRVNFVLRTPQGASVFLCHRDRLIAQIGHELQHAVEIARNPEVVDEATLAALYIRIGHQNRSNGYESDEAIRSGELVLVELHSAGASSPASSDTRMARR
jgi:hypothetical protein